MDLAISAIAFAQYGLISRTQLLALGMTGQAVDHRLAVGRLRRLHPGIYAVGGAYDSWEQRTFAASMAAGEGALLSHDAAGRFWRLDGIRTDHPHVLIPHDRRLRLSGVRVHRTRTLEPGDVNRRSGFALTSPVRTLIDLAGSIERERLEDALDDALRRRIVTLDQLRRRSARIPRGVRGIGRFRSVLADRSPKRQSGSPPERRFRSRLARAGLEQPIPQYLIEDVDGRFIARVDFGWPRQKLAVEIDGSHHAGRKQWKSDLARQNRMILEGWRYLRFTTEEAERDPRALSAVEEALQRNGESKPN